MPRVPSLAEIRSKLTPLKARALSLWAHYRSLPIWKQAAIAFVTVALLSFFVTILSSGGADQDEPALPTVTLASVDTLAGTKGSVTVIGSVRSITEAAILAQSGGTVTAVHTKLGSYAPPGAIIAELENAAQRAAVLQAEGSYEAALASRSSTSAGDVAASARNAYINAYSTLDSTFENYVDEFFGDPTSYGPALLIDAPMYAYGELSRDRQALADQMRTYQNALEGAGTADPLTLLANATAIANNAIAFLDKLAVAAHDRESEATSDQLSALSTARTSVNTLLSTLATARNAFRVNNTGATASADASVKVALGALRAAQAQLEKTFVRAPIGGTVNFLPIRRGDYVAALTHVATVAQNGTLELVSYVSEATRANLSVGMEVTIEDAYRGVITSIAPALDPATKQIEVRVALKEASPLVNGQSVRIALPNAVATTIASGPLLLPLTALKLTPSSRIVFSVGADDRLVAHAVEIGDVHGDRIEILSPLSPTLKIVTDARGFSEGQRVNVSSTSF